MSNVQKYIYIGFGIILAISITFNVIGAFQQRRANKLVNQLEIGYSALEKSNTILRNTNLILVDNNKRLRGEQQKSADLISAGQDIVREFQDGISNSLSTIDRIEKGFETLERLIGILFEEDEPVA